MQVECGHCKKRYNIADENAGKQFSCRACGQRSPVVPIGAAPAATDADATQAAARPAASTAVATKATISVACPNCGKQYQNVPAEAVGKPFKCKACQQVSPIQAAPARQASAATVRKDSAATKTAAPARTAVKPAAAKSAAVAAAPAMASAVPASPLASDPLGQNVFGGSANLLDLLGDAPLPGSTGTSLTSSPLLAKPLTAEPPKKAKAKKKKKKSGDGAMSDHVTVMLRMMGGGFLVLCGLALIVWGIVIISNPDDERWNPGRAIRCFVGGVSLIGGGLKAIVG
ncbi:MAG TPA: hypothetical protein VJ783_23290 [Pirellulales bacterium]|nr:hypothetical protein [Pirellulales bacterium]